MFHLLIILTFFVAKLLLIGFVACCFVSALLTPDPKQQVQLRRSDAIKRMKVVRLATPSMTRFICGCGCRITLTDDERERLAGECLTCPKCGMTKKVRPKDGGDRQQCRYQASPHV